MAKKSNKPEVRIEFPMIGATYCHEEYGVYEYSIYPRGSVLAGQRRRKMLDSFPTLELAQKHYPDATFNEGLGSGYVPY